MSLRASLAAKLFCITESSICVPKDLGSNATLTPVPKTPFELNPTHPVKNKQIKLLKEYCAKDTMAIYDLIKYLL